jgi:hypothetical protein
MTYTFIINVEKLDIIEKHWSRFQGDNVYTIENFLYNDLIQSQNTKIKIINGIYCDGDEGYIDNIQVLRDLLEIKSHSDNFDEIRKIKNQINFIQDPKLTKDKRKRLLRQRMNLNHL